MTDARVRGMKWWRHFETSFKDSLHRLVRGTGFISKNNRDERIAEKRKAVGSIKTPTYQPDVRWTRSSYILEYTEHGWNHIWVWEWGWVHDYVPGFIFFKCITLTDKDVYGWQGSDAFRGSPLVLFIILSKTRKTWGWAAELTWVSRIPYL
jgi:hypothetical protein